MANPYMDWWVGSGWVVGGLWRKRDKERGFILTVHACTIIIELYSHSAQK